MLGAKCGPHVRSFMRPRLTRSALMWIRPRRFCTRTYLDAEGCCAPTVTATCDTELIRRSKIDSCEALGSKFWMIGGCGGVSNSG
jgi:hypothetical protein